MSHQPLYVVVSPVRDEARHLRETLSSMLGQTVRPHCWVIVNDGSTDDTGSIADQWALEHSWIRVVHRADRGHRAAGGGVVEAFKTGYALVETEPWEYLTKLDGDLSFETDYFERCLREFEQDPKLGIGGGVIWNIENGRRVFEQHPDFHVRGATKIYRRACWDQIGGLVTATGWDTIDEVAANMAGWTTRTFREIELNQLRGTGSVEGPWRDSVKNGKAAYMAGYHPAFLIARAARRSVRPPILVAGAGLIRGYFGVAIRRRRRAIGQAHLRYVRQQQRNRLLGRPTMWR